MKSAEKIIKGLLCLILITTITRVQAQQSDDLTFDQFSLATSMDASARDIMRFNYPLGKTKFKSNKTTTFKTANLSYTPSAKLREQTVARFANRLQAGNPAMAKALMGAFGPEGKLDYSDLYTNAVGRYGFRGNDLGDAVTATLILGYVITNNLQADNAVTNSQVAAVRRQFAPSLMNNPKLATPGFAAQAGEELKLQFILQQLGWQSAIKKGNTAQYGRKINAEIKSRYGMDMTQVRITEQGFAKK